MSITLVDCTLRDGGYYNDWNFAPALIDEYLRAMEAISADFVELGFRSFEASGFKGGCAYTTDTFLRQLSIPPSLKVGVMVNGSEIVKHPDGPVGALRLLFSPADASPVSLVRIACHLHEFEEALHGCVWLKQQGYTVGINLMQIADRTPEEIENVARLASQSPIDVLYFADSMGSMDPEQTTRIVSTLRRAWAGPLGIHTHDNMGQALANSMRAVGDGVTWIDGTVTGMGRGPGNVKTEYLVLELAPHREARAELTLLLALIRKLFRPMQNQYGWGTNTFYFLAGKYGIHPTYVQEMLNDSRYGEADILHVIEHLRQVGGKKFSLGTLESSRDFYVGEPRGTWRPVALMEDRDVLIVGSGPGASEHRLALESFIRRRKPIVLALNTHSAVAEDLIDLRAACHPTRLLADTPAHSVLPQPLATPASMLPERVRSELGSKKALLDFGIGMKPGAFEFHAEYALLPSSLVIAYALAIATSGMCRQILLAGFDGYPAGDPRNEEMERLLAAYRASTGACRVISVTPTTYGVETTSVYFQG